MSVRVPGRRATAPDDGTDTVAARLRALDRVVELGAGRLADDTPAPAAALARRAGERMRLSAEHTVVALAGATGSGKSSLFNAVAGVEVSRTGVRRPTTGVAHAVVWDADGAGPLLDWLEIPRRHALSVAAGDDTRGLVLLDLPDHDSTAVAHRLEVDRLVALVDVLVWVLDPQKYADAAIHDRYLRPLARHGEVMVVVLNQVDLLPADVVPDAVADVRRLLAQDGLVDVPVLTTSAVTEGGVDGLREVLAGAVTARRAALRRIAADLDRVAADLAPLVGTGAGTGIGPSAERDLVTALGTAAGITTVGAAVQRASLHRAVGATGFPFTRWLRRFRPDPLRRLHLDRVRAVTGGRSAAEDEAAGSVARSSLPAAGVVERSRVDLAVRRLADDAASGLPDPWPGTVHRAARSRTSDLADALDRAVTTTDLGVDRTPVWWRAVGLLQTLLAVAVVAGTAWLVGLYALSVLRLPEPEPPQVGLLPLPTVLLLGGLVAGLLLAVLARAPAALGARRRRAAAERRLRTAVADVADELVLSPVRAELDAVAALHDAVERLRRR